MMGEEKYNYAVVRSTFGDYWIGKTKLSEKPGSIFSSFADALEEVKGHASYVDVIEMESEDYEAEVILEVVEKFII